MAGNLNTVNSHIKAGIQISMAIVNNNKVVSHSIEFNYLSTPFNSSHLSFAVLLISVKLPPRNASLFDVFHIKSLLIKGRLQLNLFCNCVV